MRYPRILGSAEFLTSARFAKAMVFQDALDCGLHNHLGRAWNKERLPPFHGEPPNVQGVKAVDVFLEADGSQDALLVDVLRKGQLHQNP